MKAADEGLAMMHKLVESGEAKDGAEAYTLLHKRHPDVVKRYREEGAQRLSQGHTPPPLDYSQRQALLAKQEPFPLTVPPPATPLETWEGRVERLLAANPGMSLDAAARSVMAQTGGRQAYEYYRQQQLFGRQG